MTYWSTVFYAIKQSPQRLPPPVSRSACFRGVGREVLGSIIALAVTRLLRTLVYGISDHDPVTFALVAVLLCLVAIAASYVPARCAARVNAIEALRAD